MGKWIKRLLILLVLLAVGGYFGIPKLVGTTWAKEKVRTALAEKTGRDVEVGTISFGWTDGLSVSDVLVKQKPGDADADGPLFQLAGLSLKVGLKDLLDKRINVEDLTVDGPRIVIIRDASGRFNFDDLLEKASEKAPTPPEGEKAPPPPEGEKGPPPPEGEKGPPPDVTATLTLENGRILYVDVPLGTRVEMEGIDGEVTWNSGKLDLDLTFELNGGDVKMKANADLSKTPSPFKVSEFVVDEATLAANVPSLGYFLPLLGDKPQTLSGTLGFELRDFAGKGLDMESLRRDVTGSGKVSLEGGTVMSGVVVQMLNAIKAIGAGDLSALSLGDGGSQGLEVKLMSSDFALEGGRIKTENMKLEGNGVDISLSGSTGLDGTVDYTIHAGLGALLETNENLKKYLGEDGTLPMTLKGALDAPKVSVDAEGALRGAADRLIEEKLGDRVPGGLKGLLPGGK